MVYMGLSLFIIRLANVYLVVCILTCITLQSGLAQVIDIHLPEKGLGEWWKHIQDPFLDVGM